MSDLVDLPVLYCDSALLVVDKPAGLSTLPDGYNPSLPHIKSLLESAYGRLWIVHRLDKDTSGVLVLARTALAHRSLNTQFERHLVVKVYHALVAGNPPWQELAVDLALRPNGDRQHRTVVDLEGGKPAITHLKVLERLGAYCLIEAIPETGRTHQIRVHLSAMGLSIVGDKLYPPKNAAPSSGEEKLQPHQGSTTLSLPVGMALHARSLQVAHPLTGEKLVFIAPYPAGLLAMLQRLGSKA